VLIKYDYIHPIKLGKSLFSFLKIIQQLVNRRQILEKAFQVKTKTDGRFNSVRTKNLEFVRTKVARPSFFFLLVLHKKKESALTLLNANN
jgi:hypothetical protein